MDATTTYHQHRAMVLYSPSSQNGSELVEKNERFRLTRQGRWQGAMFVLFLAFFWRFFLIAGLVGLVFGMSRRRRAHLAQLEQDESPRWRRRRRRHLEGDRDEPPMLLGEADEAEMLSLALSEHEATEQHSEHRQALADFDRRLAESIIRERVGSGRTLG